jgi:hypothetical protein
LLALATAALTLAGSSSAAFAQSAQDQHPSFVTQLQTGDEVPAKPSTANGYAAVLVKADGSAIYYTVVLTDPSSQVTASHIHIAPPGQNGPVVVPFCGTPNTPACGQDGVIAEGSFTDANLSGTMSGASLGDMVDAIRAGNAYVNVHTTKFPDGEARGQLMDTTAADTNMMELPLQVQDEGE